MSGQPEVTSRDRRELSESLVKYRGFPCFLGCLPGGVLSDFHAHGRPDRCGVLSGLMPFPPFAVVVCGVFLACFAVIWLLWLP